MLAEAAAYLTAIVFLLRGGAASCSIIHVTCWRSKGPYSDMATIQNLSDEVNKLLFDREDRRRQEKGIFKEDELHLFSNAPDGLRQDQLCLVDALETEGFLIAARDVMEHVDGSGARR